MKCLALAFRFASSLINADFRRKRDQGAWASIVDSGGLNLPRHFSHTDEEVAELSAILPSARNYFGGEPGGSLRLEGGVFYVAHAARVALLKQQRFEQRVVPGRQLFHHLLARNLVMVQFEGGFTTETQRTQR